MKVLFLILIFMINLFSVTISELIKTTANSLINLDKKQLEVTLKSFLLKNKDIKAIKVIKKPNNFVFLEVYKKDNKLIYNKLPKEIFNLDKQIKYIKVNNEIIGKLVFFRNNKSILTLKEKKWIKNHVVTFGVEQWSPVVFSNNGNDIDGICGDFTKLIVKKTGLKIKVVNDKWNNLLNNFKLHKIDVLPATFYTTQRAKYGLYSKPYFKMKNYLYVREDSNIKSFYDVKTLAIIKGYGTIPAIRKKFPNIKIIQTKDLLDSINKVLNKKVDALYDGQAVVTQTITKNLIKGLKPISQNIFPPDNLYYFINKNQPILLSIIQKALNAITPQEKTKILSKWLSINNIYINLTKQEKEWIAKNIEIKYAYDPDWKPIEWANDIKQPEGIIKDVLNLVMQRTQLNIQMIYSKSWKDVLYKIKTDKVDAYATSKNNNPNLNFTKHTIIKIPYVFVTRIKSEYIDNIKSIKNKRIGVFKESSIYNLIKKDYPNIKLICFTSDKDGFKMLKNGTIDVAIYNFITAKYYINLLGLNKVLKINDKTKYYLELRIAVNKNLGEIPVNILDKGLASISKKEMEDIIDKWTHVYIKQKTDWVLIIEIIGVLLFIVTLMIFYNYKLNKSVKEKTYELSSLLEAYEHNVIASKIDKDGNITYVSEAFCKISGYSKDELIGKYHNIVIHPEQKSVFKEIRKTIIKGKPWKGELKQIKKNGEIYWVETVITPEMKNGEIIGFSAIRHDITAKKEVEKLSKNLEKIVEERTKELALQKAYLESFFENRGVGILLVDKNRTNIKVNKKLCEIWGYKEEELIGKNAVIFHVSEESYIKFGEIAFSQVKNNKKVEIEYQFKKKNGEIFWAKFYGEFIGNGNVLWVINDITKEKNYQLKIEKLHKHTKESIEFASLLQNALLPDEKDMDLYFKDKFVFWKPKDIVGGDIYLFEHLRNENECLLMVIDCTGHGVPGAFVTMIVKAVEREIASKIKEDKTMQVSPAWILSYFNKTIKRLLRQDSKDSMSNAGFDGGIIYYDRKAQIVKFSGANTPLFYIDENKQLQTIKGDRYSVGYNKCDINYKYTEHIISVSEGMKFYLTTDGYIDQNGGEKDFPFGKKRFKRLIESNYNLPMQKQKEIFIEEIEKWEKMQKNNERNDDMTIVAFEIDKKSETDIILEYEGILTQAIIAHNIDIIEHSINNINIVAKLSTLVVEVTQNMMKYSKTHEIGCRDIRPAGYIRVMKIDNNYFVESKNIVSIDDKMKIEKTLQEISKLDEKELKKRYRELRRSGENMHNQGGGIGFYEIAKLSKDIEYKFEKINQDKFYFTMKIIIKPKKRI